MASDEAVIRTRRLTKTFGRLRAVDEVDLEVPKGCVFGLAGRNGAGKTTLISMLLGLLRATRGSAGVLGMDPRRQDVAIRRQVGYVPETHGIYPWMKVREVLRFCAPFYPTWDRACAGELVSRFELDPEKKVRELSRGMVAELGLALALAHRPSLLILDEPTSGLDVVVRREFLESIVRMISEEGRTVFISSHLLEDVERIADRIGFMEGGRLVRVEELGSLKARFRRVRIAFTGEPPERLELEGIGRLERDGQRFEVTFDGFGPETMGRLREAFPAAQMAEEAMSLEEIFVEMVGRRPRACGAAGGEASGAVASRE